VLPLAAKYDVDLQSMYDVISVSGGNSKSFQGVMPRFMKRDFDVRFWLGLVHKDIRCINDLVRRTLRRKVRQTPSPKSSEPRIAGAHFPIEHRSEEQTVAAWSSKYTITSR